MIPDHLHQSLKSACRMAIIAGNHIGEIKLDRWASTFGCDREHVTDMWAHELTKLSRQPRNSFEEAGE